MFLGIYLVIRKYYVIIITSLLLRHCYYVIILGEPVIAIEAIITAIVAVFADRLIGSRRVTWSLITWTVTTNLEKWIFNLAFFEQIFKMIWAI